MVFANTFENMGVIDIRWYELISEVFYVLCNRCAYMYRQQQKDEENN